MEQKHIVLAGAGMMGASLSQVYAQAGYQVSLWNGSESGLERAKNLIALNQETLRKEGMVTAEQSEELQKRITYTTSKVCMEDCDLMVEAIIENMDAKHKFWEDASRIAPEDALLATNTSGLLITEVAKSVYHPERFMGQHWLNPPHLMPLCEIIRGAAADLQILLQEGTYIQLSGPNFETPHEVKMCRILGGDAVGMSTACEAIAANHMGMKVCGISCISNLGCGMTDQPLSAEEVKETADRVAPLFKQLI